MAILPTGTVTFLFTDVEGSTRLWERHPGAMRPAQMRHDALLRAAIAGHGGRVFRPVGDGFCAVFATAPDAVAAAAAAQRALAAEPWGEIGRLAVRMALHTGAADLRDGDYFGPPLNRVARLRDAAHGGQILLSQTTTDLLRDAPSAGSGQALPEGTSLRDLGQHRLRDLSNPERIFELVLHDLPAEFPPLRTLDRLPNNLPVQPTPFIGRDHELDAIERRLRDPEVRLLTLTGPGGTGKTRLALQAAAQALEAFADGVFFVALQGLRDPRLVPSAVAQALGVREAEEQPLPARLAAFLEGKRLLLVPDNVEHLLEAVPLVADLLAACPHLKVLATSRAPLALRAERELAVPPLALPPPMRLAGVGSPAPGQRVPTVEELARYEAIQLFIGRAQAVKADFALTDENAAAVAEVCRRLDGLPLAIELAAARIRLLPPQALLARLDRRLPLLTGGARDLPARQQTLRDTIAWSYDLLNPDEQALFRRLAVFAGGFTLDAAEAAAGAIDAPRSGEESLPNTHHASLDVLEGLEALVARSLVRQTEAAGGEPRFGMFETIREFALEQSAAHGETEALRRRHAQHFVALAEAAEPKLKSAEQGTWLSRLEAEHDNLRAALQWLLGQRQVWTAVRFAGTLWWFWFVRGHLTEGRRWLEAALALLDSGSDVADTDESPEPRAQMASRAKALNGAGILAHYQGDCGRAAVLCAESLAIYRELGDRAGVAEALHGLAIVARAGGNYAAARTMYEEALGLVRELGDKWRIAYCLNYLAYVLWLEGDHAAARPLAEEELTVSRQLGVRQFIGYALTLLGCVAFSAGEYATARARHEEALAILRELGDTRTLSRVLYQLGDLTLAEGDAAAARPLYAQILAMQREMGDRFNIARCLDGLAGVCVAEGQPARAARLFGAAEALREAIGAPVAPVNRAALERNVAAARAALREAAFAAAWAAGRAMTPEQAVAAAGGATNGEGAVPPPPAAFPAQESAGVRQVGGQPGTLSRREREVAALVAQGLSNREVAARLVITARTAETHVVHILGKLGFSSRAQIAAWAVQYGLLPAQSSV